jgi:hypothetical protein
VWAVAPVCQPLHTQNNNSIWGKKCDSSKEIRFPFPYFLSRSSGNNHFHCCLSRPHATVVGWRFTKCEPSFLQSSCAHRKNRSSTKHVRLWNERAGTSSFWDPQPTGEQSAKSLTQARNTLLKIQTHLPTLHSGKKHLPL